MCIFGLVMFIRNIFNSFQNVLYAKKAVEIYRDPRTKNILRLAKRKIRKHRDKLTKKRSLAELEDSDYDVVHDEHATEYSASSETKRNDEEKNYLFDHTRGNSEQFKGSLNKSTKKKNNFTRKREINDEDADDEEEIDFIRREKYHRNSVKTKDVFRKMNINENSNNYGIGRNKLIGHRRSNLGRLYRTK